MESDKEYKKFAGLTMKLFNQSIFLRELIREHAEVYSDLFIKCEKDREDAATMVCSIVNLCLKKISAKVNNKDCFKDPKVSDLLFSLKTVLAFFEEARSLYEEVEGLLFELKEGVHCH